MTSLFDRFVLRYGRLPTEMDPDYLEMLRMSKYRILAVPDVPPGICSNCGASKQDGRKYVDIGRHIEWYGAVYFCTLCLNDIAKAAGIFDKYKQEIERLQKDKAFFDALQLQGAHVKETVQLTLREVTKYFDNLYSLGDGSGPGINEFENPDQTATESVISAPRADQTESGIGSTKPRVTKSTPSSRPKDLPSLADLLNAD